MRVLSIEGAGPSIGRWEDRQRAAYDLAMATGQWAPAESTWRPSAI